MDSPLSEADSLSSAGASTEPLPASDLEDDTDDDLSRVASPARLPPPPPPLPRARKPSKGGNKNGNESDSSLTEQSSSDNEREEASDEEEDADDDDDAGRRRVGSSPELGTISAREVAQEDEEDEEPTPRPSGTKRARNVISDDEEEEEELERQQQQQQVEEEEEEDAIMALAAGAALKRTTSTNASEAAVRRVIENGAGGDESPFTDSEDEDARSKNPLLQPPPAKRVKKGGSANGSVVSASTAEGLTALVAADSLDGGAQGTKRARSASAARSDSPLSVVSSSASEGEVEGPVAAKPKQPQANQFAGVLAAKAKEEETAEDSVDEPLAAVVSAAGGRGKGARGRGRGKVVKARGGAAAKGKSVVSMSRSTSAESSSTDALPLPSTSASASTSFSSRPLTAGVSSGQIMPFTLPVPSGLVELDTAPSAPSLAAQLDSFTPNGASQTTLSGSGGGEADEDGMELDTPLPEPENDNAVDTDASPPPPSLPQPPAQPTTRRSNALGALPSLREPSPEPTPEPERVLQPTKRAAPASAKKGKNGGAVGGGGGGKGGKKGGKGKEKAAASAAVDTEWTPGDESGVAGEGGEAEEEEEDLSDAALQRKRAEAMEALTRIEIQFAQLRDVLYLERMEEIEEEREGIENGTHPELLHLTQLIELRRDNKLHLARQWLEGLEQAYQLQYDHNEHALWNRWQDERARLRTRMLEDANGKRRRLEREKRVLDRPKDDSLAHLLAPRQTPAVPLHYRRRLGFDGEPLVEHEIEWALRHPDARAEAAPKGLEDEAAYGDLERMGLREPVRPMYPYDGAYGHPSSLQSPAYVDPRTAQGYSAGYGVYPGGSPFDQQALLQQQQQAAQQAERQHAAQFPPLSALPGLPALPPLPSRGEPRSSSNPRSRQASGPYPIDHHHPSSSYPVAPAPRTTFSNGHYPYDLDNDQRLHGPAAWAKAQHPTHPAYQEEEQRRRTISSGGQHAMQGVEQIHNGSVAAAMMEQNGGRITPTAAAGVKARLTLDSHMNHRSPKASNAAVPGALPASKVLASQTASAASSRQGSPAAFMSIPAIPPFDPHRHARRLAEAQQQSRATPPPASSSVASAPAPVAAPAAAVVPPPPPPAAAALPALAKPLFPTLPPPSQPPAPTAAPTREGQFPVYAPAPATVPAQRAA